jgi:hypothetical protein
LINEPSLSLSSYYFSFLVFFLISMLIVSKNPTRRAHKNPFIKK